MVVPDVDVIKSWACENRIPGTLSVLCAHPEVKQLIIDDMISWGKEAGLKSFEQVCSQQSAEGIQRLFPLTASLILSNGEAVDNKSRRMYSSLID